MTRIGFIRLLVLAALASFALPALAGDAPAKKYKLLFLTQSGGFQHSAIKRPGPGMLSPAELAVTEIGNTSGLFETRCTKDASVITPELLKETDIIMFYTTGNIISKDQPEKPVEVEVTNDKKEKVKVKTVIGPGSKPTPKTPENEWVKFDEPLPITAENYEAFDAWLKSGKAFVGTHSATDTMGNNPGYFKLINGTFNGHPWGSGTTVTVTNHEPTHPTVKMWEPEFTFKDEIYQYKNYDPNAVRVLLSLNMEKCQPKMPWMVPVSWVRDYGTGRLFYTNLGHNDGTWKDEKFRAHVLAGIRWALKLEEGPSAPNPELQAEIQKKSKEAGIKGFVGDLAKAAGKDEAELIAKFEKASAANPEFADKMLPKINGVRGIDAKKDAEKKKTEALKVAGEIEEAGK